MAVVRLGCSVATRKERERQIKRRRGKERGSKTVKKRTCDEKRGDKRTWGIDTDRAGRRERRVKRSREWLRERSERASEESNEESRS